MEKSVFFFGDGGAEGSPERVDLLGGKGAGLAEMSLLGLPVPPGFTISTTVCKAFLATKKMPESARRETDAALARLEAVAGARLGDSGAPLLVSVRSGARVSMPGMMDTILNVGQNDAVVSSASARTQSARFAYDTYRRFLAMHATVALGLRKEPFERVLEDARARVATAMGMDQAHLNAEELKRRVPDAHIPAEELAAVATEFKAIVREETGHAFPSDPREQLWQAIAAIFASWNGPRATAYRAMHGIPDDWGTACTVQAMVFGNRSDTSATGVAFTRDPSTGERAIYGEWLPNAQGEDVVAGIRTPLPLRAVRREGAAAAPSDESLETRMPDAYLELCRVASLLEQCRRDAQDLEFTIENGRFYLLQCRQAKRAARASVRIAVEMANEGALSREEAVLRVDPAAIDSLLCPTLDPQAKKKLLAQGLPASPGAATGQIVFGPDEAERRAGQGVAVILVRSETSPEDIGGMKAARGTLTARGGMTSHAAVVARGIGKPCVAGVRSIAVHYDTQTMEIGLCDEVGRLTVQATLKKGDVITIDGGSGQVYAGAVPTVSTALSGEFGELLGWADSVRTTRVRANADTAPECRSARNFGAEGIGLCRTEHMFFDGGRIQSKILAEDGHGRRAALAELLPLHRQDFAHIFREMAGLPVTIRLLDASLHERYGAAAEGGVVRSDGTFAAGGVVRSRDAHMEIHAMQVRAIFEAAAQVAREGTRVLPEIMMPLSIGEGELAKTRAVVDALAEELLDASPVTVHFSFGAAIQIPDAPRVAGELALAADFFSFDTGSPARTGDPELGARIETAAVQGRRARPALKVGLCGEHAGDPTSLAALGNVGLDYVSCDLYRLPVARLATAQAALRARA